VQIQVKMQQPVTSYFDLAGRSKRLEALWGKKWLLGNTITLKHEGADTTQYILNGNSEFEKHNSTTEDSFFGDDPQKFYNITEVLIDIYQKHSGWETIETACGSFLLSVYSKQMSDTLNAQKNECCEILVNKGLPQALVEANILNTYIEKEANIILAKSIELLINGVCTINSF
jgi:hypothetical protein